MSQKGILKPCKEMNMAIYIIADLTDTGWERTSTRKSNALWKIKCLLCFIIVSTFWNCTLSL